MYSSVMDAFAGTIGTDQFSAERGRLCLDEPVVVRRGDAREGFRGMELARAPDWAREMHSIYSQVDNRPPAAPLLPSTPAPARRCCGPARTPDEGYAKPWPNCGCDRCPGEACRCAGAGADAAPCAGERSCACRAAARAEGFSGGAAGALAGLAGAATPAWCTPQFMLFVLVVVVIVALLFAPGRRVVYVPAGAVGAAP